MSSDVSGVRERPDGGMDVHLSPKALIFATLAFAGGGIAGGGVTLTREAVPPTLAADVAEVKQGLQALQVLPLAIAKLEGQLSSGAADARRLDEVIKDHEKRLRELELRRGVKP